MLILVCPQRASWVIIYFTHTCSEKAANVKKYCNIAADVIQYQTGGAVMDSIGSYLKKQRERLSLSLNAVCDQTGITSTRLNRIERNLVNEPSPEALKKLAGLYQIDLIYLYKLAGYLDNFDTKGQVQPFTNYEILNDDERNFIQQSINFLAEKHFTTN